MANCKDCKHLDIDYYWYADNSCDNIKDNDMSDYSWFSGLECDCECYEKKKRRYRRCL